MDIVIKGIQDKLQTISEIKYVDEDWGQLDYYSPNFPVQWPCVLIDVSEVHYKDLARDHQLKPVNRQTAEISVTLTIANMRLNNTSGRAPTIQKIAVRSIHKLIEDIHKKIHGKPVHDKTGLLIRQSMNRIKRDDGVQEYNVMYKMRFPNV